MKNKIIVFKICLVNSTKEMSTLYIIKIYLLQTWTYFSTVILKITDHNSRNLLNKVSNVDMSRPINNIQTWMCTQWLVSRPINNIRASMCLQWLVNRPINNIQASMCPQWLVSNTYTRIMSISFFLWSVGPISTCMLKYRT